MRKTLFVQAVLAAGAASAEPMMVPVAPGMPCNMPGMFAYTIKPGTNVVEKLPFTKTMLPRLKDVWVAKPGDTFVWGDEVHTFDGKTWSGPNGGDALIPIYDKFVIIRTAKEESVYHWAGEIDEGKMPKQ